MFKNTTEWLLCTSTVLGARVTAENKTDQAPALTQFVSGITKIQLSINLKFNLIKLKILLALSKGAVSHLVRRKEL